LGVFAAILGLAKLRLPLASAILIGAIILGALFGLDAPDIALTVLHGLTQHHTLALGVVMFLLLVLSDLLRASGQLARIVDLAQIVLQRPAPTIALLPALLGLLPMPGGALFSAPMVESAAGPQKGHPAVLSAVNYWYRHIWEHWWPLYPGVMLAVSLTPDTYGRFLLNQLPLGLFMTAAGILLFRQTHPQWHIPNKTPRPHAKRKLFWAVSPIWVILIVWLGLKALLCTPPLKPLNTAIGPVFAKYLPLAIALTASLAWTIRTNRITIALCKATLMRPSVYLLVTLVFSVLVFQHVLDRVSAADQISQELLAARVPIVLIVALLPFIAGFVTGIAIGFVGTSFPIVLGLIHVAQVPSVWPYVALAYAFGHLGQMFSPLHVCHIVSNAYFKTPYGPVYHRMWPSGLATALLAIAYFACLYAIL